MKGDTCVARRRTLCHRTEINSKLYRRKRAKYLRTSIKGRAVRNIQKYNNMIFRVYYTVTAYIMSPGVSGLENWSFV